MVVQPLVSTRIRGLVVLAFEAQSGLGRWHQLEDVPVDEGGTSGSGVGHHKSSGRGVALTVGSLVRLEHQRDSRLVTWCRPAEESRR
jgi:hypothetical protein